MIRYPSPRPKTAMPYVEPTLRAAPALPDGFVVAAPVVVAALKVGDVKAVEETFPVTAP
jgi:hypothetical protein